MDRVWRRGNIRRDIASGSKPGATSGLDVNSKGQVMTNKSPISRPLFALAAALFATPLAAQNPVSVTGQPVYQEPVSYADLDLRDSSGRQKLIARVHRAAKRVCTQFEWSNPYETTGFMSSPGCTELTYANARPQIRAAVDRAKSGQPILAANLVVSAPVNR